MLLSSSQVITRSQPQEESSLPGKIEEASSMLRRKIEELNKNTVFLIAEAGKLIKSRNSCRFAPVFRRHPHEAEVALNGSSR